MNIKKEDFVFTVRRPYAPLFLEAMLRGQSVSANFKSIVNKKFAFKDILSCETDIYYGKKEINELTKITFNSWKKQAGFAKAKEILLRRERDLLKAASGKNVDAFYEAMKRYAPALMTVFTIGKPVEKELRYVLAKKISATEVEALMDNLNIPWQDNFYKQEEYDLATAKDLRKHVKEYEWINSRYGSYHPYTIEDAQKKLSIIHKKQFLKQWKEEKKRVKNAVRLAKQLSGKGHLVDVLQFIVYYRTQRTDIFNKAIYLFMPELKKLADMKGLTYMQLIHCTKKELKGRLPPITIINERIEGFTEVVLNGKLEIVSGEESKKIKEMLAEDIVETEELEGVVVCNGLVNGNVKIVASRDDLSKVHKGDILITSMTTPEMIAVMKMAAAFVTDEGGITCHAAIIAREMKKPCIIGTKIATKVFKDGDLVEVDADKGIIRKVDAEKGVVRKITEKKQGE